MLFLGIIQVDARTPIFNKHLYFRTGVTYVKKLQSPNIRQFVVPVMFDIHPLSSSGFKMSLGLAYNGNKIYSVKDNTEEKNIYKPFLPMSPIVSIGYDDSFINDSSWSNYCEFRIMYNGAFSNSKGQTYGSENKHDKTTELLARFNPIIKIGIRYRF